ncbi:MAG TPA: VOC family protein [Thermoanaerobaculia bacterium]|nr:VOC family protein [Thermoanaerobaculia bacterium]
MNDPIAQQAAPPPTLGHVHLEVTDLERSVEFYRTLLGLELVERAGRFAFLSATDRHHELALQELPRRAAPAAGPPAADPPRPGLYHLAFEVADEAALRGAAARARALGAAVASVDHGISWALYLSDPDDLGVEVYLDRRSAPGGTPRWEGRSRPLRL